MKDIILIGGGGHCRSCIEVIEQRQDFNIIGILDSFDKIGLKVLGYPIVGIDDDISDFEDRDVSFLVTIGQIKTNNVRKNMYEKLMVRNLKLATIASPYAIISKFSSVGMGTILMHNVILNSNSSIGENCIINTKALIEHDCKIGNHTHISTGTLVNGGCNIGENVFIGSGSVIGHGVTIGDNIIIGAGSLVLKSVIDEGLYIGCPIRRIS